MTALRFACRVLPLLASTLVSAQETPIYSFGVVPQYEALKLADTWIPLLREVGSRAGVKLEMAGTPGIPDFEQAFTAGDFDFAYMNPYHAIMASRSQGYQPLIRDGERLLFGILVVRADSSFDTVDDLHGARIAFPAPNALGASLLMRANLTRKFDLRYQPIYAQTHTSSYLNVLLNKAEAAGGVRSTLDQQPGPYQNNLRVIYETQRVPAHPVVAHPRIPAATVSRVLEAFLDLGDTEAGRALLSGIPMTRPIPTSANDYRPLEQLNLEQFLVPASGETPSREDD